MLLEIGLLLQVLFTENLNTNFEFEMRILNHSTPFHKTFLNKISTITQYFFIFQKKLVLSAPAHLKSPIQYGFPRII